MMRIFFRRPAALLWAFCLLGLLTRPIFAQPPNPKPIAFTQGTLSNGLRVIYAPLHQAPVVHVRILYHVGSRDERPDRRGFAHMFEHMMFRGSAHVAPQEHPKLLNDVGGMANAFTSFDQTVYVNTIPAEHLEMALYLEADRMSSFKVSDSIYQTERQVVAEEWRMRQNKPYGTVYEEFFKTAFTTPPYRSTPIGNMDHLRAASAGELQEFFNRYYVPNNAVLVIAGDIEPAAAHKLVEKYFAWIPRAPDVVRNLPVEPPQTQARRIEVPQRVPLAMVLIGYHSPPYRSDDHYALSLLTSILGDGQASRLDRMLVNSANPLCVSAYAMNYRLEDGGIVGLGATIMAGKDPATVEKLLAGAVADVIAHGVTPEELAMAKLNSRIAIIHQAKTAENIADQLGTESLLTDDPARVNSELANYDAVTLDQIKAVAAKYLRSANSTILVLEPAPVQQTPNPATAPAKAPASTAAAIPPRVTAFPPDYPTTVPMASPRASAKFAKGVEQTIDGVRVITMSDPRLPLANFILTLRRGSHSDPAGKEGLANLTAEMLRRGTADLSFEQLNQDLESRGISIEVSPGSDNTRLSGSCTTDQLQHAILRARQVLRNPTFPAQEFRKLKEQILNSLRVDEDNPASVADDELTAAIWGEQSVLGRYATPRSVTAITLEDVKRFYADYYHPDDAILVFSGDITAEQARTLGGELLQEWPAGTMAQVQYPSQSANPPRPRVIIIDRPEGKQAPVRMGLRAYDNRTDVKFAGSVANQILSGSMDSRLGRYVRSEKGLAYSVGGGFAPTRFGGVFSAETDTRTETVGDAVTAMLKVFGDMRDADVTPKELASARLRVAGSMVMSMQTIDQQASYRLEGILNSYPIDYYDHLPARIAAVTATQVRAIMNRYVRDADMIIAVVAPAAAVKDQLKKFGPVEIVPMPAQRKAAAPATKKTALPD